MHHTMLTALKRLGRALSELHSDDEGAVMTETLEVMMLVCIGAAVAAGPVGVAVVRHYELSEFILGLPIP